MFRKRFLAVLGAAVATVVMGTATAAAADEPVRQTVTLHRVLADQCPFGPIVSVFDVTREITTFAQDGVPVRRLIHGHGTGTITNPATGRSLYPVAVNRIFVFDLTDGSAFTVGTNPLVRLPDGGAVVVAGMMVFDGTGELVATHGSDSDAAWAEICAALAP